MSARRANPAATLGGPPLDFGVAANLMLAPTGMRDTAQVILRDCISVQTGQKVMQGDVGSALAEHMKGLKTAAARTEFIDKLVVALKSIRAAAKETSLYLVSDETDCEKVITKATRLLYPIDGCVERVAAAEKEFKLAFEKCMKEATTPPKK